MKKVKIGRNEACPCGSGIKYKKCCATGKRHRSFFRNPLFVSVLMILCLMTYSFAALLSSEDRCHVVTQGVRPEVAKFDIGTVTEKNGSSHVNRNAYDFNAQKARSGSARDGHTERQPDLNGGTYNLRARQYDPGTGRFLTPDSWEGDTTRPETLNKYTYAHANPVNRTDPSGHFTIGEINTAFTIRNVLTDLQINTGISLADSYDAAQNDPSGKAYAEEQSKSIIFSAMTGMAPRLMNLIGKRNKDRILKVLGICFVAGTLVHTPDGLSYPIEEMEKGDQVSSYNDGEIVLSRITDTFK